MTERFHRAQVWPPTPTETETGQLRLPLPERPGLKFRRYADICPRCRSVHLNPVDATVCQQANAQREQY